MPKEPSLPAVHLAGVERARYLAAVERQGDENGREIAAGKAPPGTSPVRGVDPVRGASGRRDARSHEVPKKKRVKKKDVEKTPTPPDPSGRGRQIDLKA